jgi:hypothetical protein
VLYCYLLSRVITIFDSCGPILGQLTLPGLCPLLILTNRNYAISDYVIDINKLVYQVVYQAKQNAPLSRKNDVIVHSNVTVCHH